MTSNTAPAHLHATGVAVYPALFPIEKVHAYEDNSVNVVPPAVRLLLSNGVSLLEFCATKNEVGKDVRTLGSICVLIKYKTISAQ